MVWWVNILFVSWVGSGIELSQFLRIFIPIQTKEVQRFIEDSRCYHA